MSWNNTVFNIIPAIDILDGQVVRLHQGRYSEKEVYDRSALDWVRFYESEGASRIHIVDLNGAKAGHLVNESLLKSIRNTAQVELEIGGGIRSLAQAKQLIDLGYHYLILGSLIVKDPEESLAICEAFPKQIYAGLDTHDSYLATEGWEEKSNLHLHDIIQKLNTWPLAGFILTDIAKDGTLSGPNLAYFKKACEFANLPVIASGGIGCENDIAQLQALDCLAGCITGKAVLENKISLKNLYQG